MNSTVAKMLGQPLLEDDVPPVLGNRSRATQLRREVRTDRHHRQRRIAAQIMGMSESEEETGIFPNDAKEVENPGASYGSMKTDDTNLKKEQTNGPTNPYHDGESSKEPLMAPSVALVAPDVTPDALEPIDPSEVPLPPEAARDAQVPSHPAPAPTDGVNPMDVLLGRTSPKSGPPVNPAAGVAAAESMFQMASSALTPGEGMPSHEAGDAKKIIESYRRFGPL